mmetsp:Transcript_7791/g.15165  ORF Transcript_7791/g.15165 Transcript_7791/m.15165 type:complete len:116 (+) Transcript_7791:276-623(+)
MLVTHMQTGTGSRRINEERPPISCIHDLDEEKCTNTGRETLLLFASLSKAAAFLMFLHSRFVSVHTLGPMKTVYRGQNKERRTGNRLNGSCMAEGSKRKRALASFCTEKDRRSDE